MDFTIRHSSHINELITLKVKDPTTFEFNSSEYTNYKLKSRIKNKKGEFEEIVVFHRYTSFEILKKELESNDIEVPDEFPQKPSLIDSYGQFTTFNVLNRAHKLNEWMNKLIKMHLLDNQQKVFQK